MFQNITQIVNREISYSFNDSKWKGNALSCSRKTIGSIKRNNVSDFHCLNCIHSFRTKNKLESLKNDVKRKIFVI